MRKVMICPNCQTQNPSVAKFCFNCAHKFQSQQSDETKYSKYIPPQLMNKLNESAKLGGMQKERRIVTTLFCDLKGSTAAAEQLDPEEWTEIVSGAFDHLIPPVYEYEGILARLMGDAILAFFGAPIAHEDDAERAVLAALKIVEGVKIYSEKIKREWGFHIEARIGINTGLVVVGEIGSDMRVEYTAMGDAINIASRMETTAEPGTIQITSETNKRIAYMFETEKLGLIELRGKSEPITAYRVIKRKQKPDSKKGLSGFDLRFIGREKELDILIQSFESSFQEDGKIIGLWGEAGIGKSRLIREFQNHLKLDGFLDDTNPTINWFETISLPYQTTTPYAPFIELLHTFFTIDFEMDNLEKYSSLKSKISEIQLDPIFIPYFSNLLNIDPPQSEPQIPSHYEPKMVQKKIDQGFLEFFKTLSQNRLTILVFDDLQWIDTSSLGILSKVIELTKSNKIMIIIGSRPQCNSRKALMDIVKKDDGLFCKEIQLIPFEAQDSNLLISNLLKIEDIPDEVRESIIQKSQGIPFYVEEMVRSLIENGDIVQQGETWTVVKDIHQIKVPENLANLLLTRLDQLNEESKRLAQTASVIGREFLFSVLSCITDFSLDRPLMDLQKKQWILEDDHQLEKQYFFKHVLSRDVAYNSLLLKRRRELHHKIATCISQINTKEVGEIGRHFYEARDYDQALPYLINTAIKAMETNANAEAHDIFKRVLEIIPNDLDFEVLKEIYVNTGKSAALNGDLDESTKYYKKLLEMSKEKKDEKGIVKGLNQLAANEVLMTRDASKADDLLNQAETLARSINFIDGIIETSTLRCVLYQGMGELDKAITWELKGALLSDEIGDPSGLPLRSNLALSYMLTQRYDEALYEATKVLETAKAMNEYYFPANVYAFIFSGINFLRGNIEKAEEYALQGHQIAEENDAQFPNHFACKMLAEIAYLKGDYDNLFKYLDYAERAIREAPNQGFAVATLISKITFKLMAGIRIDNVDEEITEALSYFKLPFGEYWGAKSWGDYGYFLLTQGDLEKAETYFRKALYTPTAPLYIYRPFNQFGLVRILFSKQKYTEALELLNESEKDIMEGDYVVYLPELYLLQGICYFKLQENEQSIAKIQDAYEKALELHYTNSLWKTAFVGSWIGESLSIPDLSQKYQKIGNDEYESIVSSIQNTDIRNSFTEKFKPIIEKKSIFEII